MKTYALSKCKNIEKYVHFVRQFWSDQVMLVGSFKLSQPLSEIEYKCYATTVVGCRGIIAIICTLLEVRWYSICMIFYKPIPNSLIFQTLTSFHRSQPPNDPQFCALPFLKA